MNRLNRCFGEDILTMHVFGLWNTSLDKIESFVEKANNFHSTIKFTAEMSKTEISFLDTKVYKGVRSDSTRNLSWGAFDWAIWI